MAGMVRVCGWPPKQVNICNGSIYIEWKIYVMSMVLFYTSSNLLKYSTCFIIFVMSSFILSLFYTSCKMSPAVIVFFFSIFCSHWHPLNVNLLLDFKVTSHITAFLFSYQDLQMERLTVHAHLVCCLLLCESAGKTSWNSLVNKGLWIVSQNKISLQLECWLHDRMV